MKTRLLLGSGLVGSAYLLKEVFPDIEALDELYYTSLGGAPIFLTVGHGKDLKFSPELGPAQQKNTMKFLAHAEISGSKKVLIFNEILPEGSVRNVIFSWDEKVSDNILKGMEKRGLSAIDASGIVDDIEVIEVFSKSKPIQNIDDLYGEFGKSTQTGTIPEVRGVANDIRAGNEVRTVKLQAKYPQGHPQAGKPITDIDEIGVKASTGEQFVGEIKSTEHVQAILNNPKWFNDKIFKQGKSIITAIETSQEMTAFNIKEISFKVSKDAFDNIEFRNLAQTNLDKLKALHPNYNFILERWD